MLPNHLIRVENHWHVIHTNIIISPWIGFRLVCKIDFGELEVINLTNHHHYKDIIFRRSTPHWKNKIASHLKDRMVELCYNGGLPSYRDTSLGESIHSSLHHLWGCDFDYNLVCLRTDEHSPTGQRNNRSCPTIFPSAFLPVNTLWVVNIAQDLSYLFFYNPLLLSRDT